MFYTWTNIYYCIILYLKRSKTTIIARIDDIMIRLTNPIKIKLKEISKGKILHNKFITKLNNARAKGKFNDIHKLENQCIDILCKTQHISFL